MSLARKLDQFYTLPHIALHCFELLKANTVLRSDDHFLEPSAGSGAFFKLMPAGRRVGVDLEPKCSGVVLGNFLTDAFPQLVRRADGAARWVTVGNPPFGKNSKLAVAFFNRAAEFSDVIAFIVPLTFKKASIQKRLDLGFHLAFEHVLEEEAFSFEDKLYAVPCAFQVWVRDAANPRVIVDAPLTHSDFEFCGPAEADFAIRRVGGLAGKVILPFEGYSPASHYYVRSRVGMRALKKRFESLSWEDVKWNTAGNPSISKREVVAKYESALTA